MTPLRSRTQPGLLSPSHASLYWASPLPESETAIDENPALSRSNSQAQPPQALAANATGGAPSITEHETARPLRTAVSRCRLYLFAGGTRLRLPFPHPTGDKRRARYDNQVPTLDNHVRLLGKALHFRDPRSSARLTGATPTLPTGLCKRLTVPGPPQPAQGVRPSSGRQRFQAATPACHQGLRKGGARR